MIANLLVIVATVPSKMQNSSNNNPMNVLSIRCAHFLMNTQPFLLMQWCRTPPMSMPSEHKQNVCCGINDLVIPLTTAHAQHTKSLTVFQNSNIMVPSLKSARFACAQNKLKNHLDLTQHNKLHVPVKDHR